jgi:hypothetical protein
MEGTKDVGQIWKFVQQHFLSLHRKRDTIEA